MYGGPAVPGATAGWLLLGLTVVLFAARAARRELRSAGPRRTAVRAGDALLALAATGAALALLVVLATLVLGGPAAAGS